MSSATEQETAAPASVVGTYAETVGAVLQRLEVDGTLGLTAADATTRLQSVGPNEVTAKSGPGPLRRFLFQFHQPLIYILVAAGLITFLLDELVDSAVIFGVVILNAVVGYFQVSRALDALAALSRTMATAATVIRDGERHAITARDVVPGDLVVIQSGDRVPADLRLVRVRELQVDESPFTGESVPVEKAIAPVEPGAALGDRSSMAFSSTLVTYGQAIGVAVATGNSTEVGRISELIASAEDIATPLTRRISSFSRILLVVILALAAFTFAVGLLHGDAPGRVFLASVALAVAAIPEGLPAAITITLAIGVNRMAGRNAIIRKLPAVETLGSTTIICSDKTGTLTQNQMTVRRIWAGGHHFGVEGSGYEAIGAIEPLDGPAATVARDRCLLAGLLCNDSSIVESEGAWSVRGDPTEAALIVSARKAGFLEGDSDRRYPRIDAVPFESLHQYMATLHRTAEGGGNVVFVKGAAEAVVQRCDTTLDGSGNAVPIDHEAVMRQVQELAGQGLRVLAFAERDLPAFHEGIGHGDLEGGLALLGLQGMIDPPRPEAIEAVRACQRAGITVKMITGDHAVTAAAIARQIGITAGSGSGLDEPEAVDGRQLEAVPDDQLPRVAEDVHVFARVPPDGKLRLVRGLQSHGHIVAMTGDGVNDGPALRQADIGIAMGRSGTEVAKDASDMLLIDDNFASIRAAVEEGRGVFDNLTKFLVFILPTNLGQGLVILVAVLLGTTLPIIPVQVLWVNLVTAVFLGLMLAFEPGERDIMNRPPRDPAAPIIERELVLRMLLVSGFLVGGAYGLFHWATASDASVEQARTVAVNLLMFVQLFYLLNCRAMTRTMFAVGLWSNPWILVGGGGMVLLQLAYTYAPFMHVLFHSEPIAFQYWLAILAVSAAVHVAVELEKLLGRRVEKPVP